MPLTNIIMDNAVIFAVVPSTAIFILALYQVYLYPRYLSPLRNVPGPPLGGLIAGQFGNIIRAEAGILQREWVKTYGSVVRAVGPFGIERLIFTKPEALSKILVSDWTDYPRVRSLAEVSVFMD